MIQRPFPLLSAPLLLLTLALGVVGCHDTFDPYFELQGVRDLEIDTYVHDEMIKRHMVGVGIAVVSQGKAVYLKGYGYEDWATRAPVDPRETLFRWASVSKTVTGTLAALLASQGRLDLDRLARESYPRFQKNYVTLRHLLTHLSGIQHYDNGSVNPTPSESDRNDPAINRSIHWPLPIWMDEPLVTLFPNFDYSYSSPAFNLAGAVIERELGTEDPARRRDFWHLVQDELTGPFGMTNFQPDRAWNGIPRRSKGYVLPSPDSSAVYEDDDSDVSWKLPSGGFISTAADAAAYCEGLLGNEYPLAAKNLLWFPSKNVAGQWVDYGLGWGVKWSDGKLISASHSGYQEKAESFLRIYPEEGLCIAVFSNTRDCDDEEGVISPREIASSIVKIIRDRLKSGKPPVVDAGQEISDATFDDHTHKRSHHHHVEKSVRARPKGFVPSRNSESALRLVEINSETIGATMLAPVDPSKPKNWKSPAK